MPIVFESPGAYDANIASEYGALQQQQANRDFALRAASLRGHDGGGPGGGISRGGYDGDPGMPTQRDAFLLAGQQALQAQRDDTHYSSEMALQEMRLSQAEQIRLNKLQQAKDAINASPDYSDEEKREMNLDIDTDRMPLQRRAVMAKIKEDEARTKEIQQRIQEINAQVNAAATMRARTDRAGFNWISGGEELARLELERRVMDGQIPREQAFQNYDALLKAIGREKRLGVDYMDNDKGERVPLGTEATFINEQRRAQQENDQRIASDILKQVDDDLKTDPAYQAEKDPAKRAAMYRERVLQRRQLYDELTGRRSSTRSNAGEVWAKARKDARAAPHFSRQQQNEVMDWIDEAERLAADGADRNGHPKRARYLELERLVNKAMNTPTPRVASTPQAGAMGYPIIPVPPQATAAERLGGLGTGPFMPAW